MKLNIGVPIMPFKENLLKKIRIPMPTKFENLPVGAMYFYQFKTCLANPFGDIPEFVNQFLDVLNG